MLACRTWPVLNPTLKRLQCRHARPPRDPSIQKYEVGVECLCMSCGQVRADHASAAQP